MKEILFQEIPLSLFSFFCISSDSYNFFVVWLEGPHLQALHQSKTQNIKLWSKAIGFVTSVELVKLVELVELVRLVELVELIELIKLVG